MKYSLAHIAALDYRWGDCQAIRYDRANESVFRTHSGSYLLDLWEACRCSGHRGSRSGILSPLFCGMADLSSEAIIAYLHSIPLIILGEWRPVMIPVDTPPPVPEFAPLGFCFMTNLNRGKTWNSGLGAYAFFQEAWRTPQQLVLTLLGISRLFYEFRLCSLHGIRYADNKLTARWMAKFGFRDLGTIPNWMVRQSTGELTDATISTLAREEFESRLSESLELGEQLEI
jgi:hypothetical protein